MASVSVASTVLNERGDIDALVESLMQQTLAPAEVIIVDGGSTDGTWERLEAARSKYATLVPIRDESCSLQRSPGPIARGRNVGIAAATSDVVACADAGCSYHPSWLANLTAPILDGGSSYSVGGSYIDPASATMWDIASAPFFGVKLNPDAATKSCTARSMAFRKVFSYSLTDGVLGGRSARLWRNIARCVAEILAVLALVYSPIPLLCVLALEVYFAFRLDWTDLRKVPFQTLRGRLIFSLIVPWVVAWYQSVGAITKKNRPNRQNFT